MTTDITAAAAATATAATTTTATAARAVHAEFMPAERDADRAAAGTARLLATILEQRASAGLGIGTGTALIRKLSKSLSAQIEAREEFVMAHKLAVELRDRLGIAPTQFGDTEPCPPDDQAFWTSATHTGAMPVAPAVSPGMTPGLRIVA